VGIGHALDPLPPEAATVTSRISGSICRSRARKHELHLRSRVLKYLPG